jgi:hypothetical protein
MQQTPLEILYPRSCAVGFHYNPAAMPLFSRVHPPTQKPVLIQALQPEAGVERLDIGVICRFPQADEVQLDMIPISPKIHILRDELWTIV